MDAVASSIRMICSFTAEPNLLLMIAIHKECMKFPLVKNSMEHARNILKESKDLTSGTRFFPIHGNTRTANAIWRVLDTNHWIFSSATNLGLAENHSSHAEELSFTNREILAILLDRCLQLPFQLWEKDKKQRDFWSEVDKNEICQEEFEHVETLTTGALQPQSPFTCSPVQQLKSFKATVWRDPKKTYKWSLQCKGLESNLPGCIWMMPETDSCHWLCYC